MFAVSCTDGTVRYISKSGREEKKIPAHEGAVILLKWTHDGSALCTAGEDGDVKIWSKNGNLRSTLVSLGQSIYALAWAPDDDHVVLGHGKLLLVKSVASSKKNLSWPAHEGVVLCVDWCRAHGSIVSGGEDCAYKVWDSFGRLLYTSKPSEHFITSVAWAPSGTHFAVGSFDLLRLCDRIGWTEARARPSAMGSAAALTFSADSTSLAAGSGSGAVLFATVLDRKRDYGSYEATLTERRKVVLFDGTNDTHEELSLNRDHVVDLGLGHGHLVLVTLSQVFVYPLGNLNTPIILDTKSAPSLLHLTAKYFLLNEAAAGLAVYNYEGKFLSNPRFPNARSDFLGADSVALANDLLAAVDGTDAKVVYLVDALSGKHYGRYVHSAEVVKVLLSPHAQDRCLVLLDRSNDLFVCNINSLPSNSPAANTSLNAAVPSVKLAAHVESVAFHDLYSALAVIGDNHFMVFHHPEMVFVHPDLGAYGKAFLDHTQGGPGGTGRCAQIAAFSGNRVTVRKIDGSVVYANTALDVPLLDDLVYTNRWDEALRLCRHCRSPALWACLAALAIARRQLDPAEAALSELGEVAKVEYMQSVRAIPSEEGRAAALLVFRRAVDEAERMLLQASPPLLYRLIKLNLTLYRHSRALELAIRYKTCVDVVCYYRAKYLESFGRDESDPKFLSQNIRVDEADVLRKEQQELDDEAARYGGSRGSNNYRK